jgi:PleD family two-component response regulator
MQMAIVYQQQAIAVTATLGIAQLDELHLELIRWQSAADIALYQGKKTGRNKVVVYQGESATKPQTI